MSGSHWLLVVLVVAGVHVAEAQQAVKVPRIGYVSRSGGSQNVGPYVEAFRQALRDLGYEEGKNLAVEYRYVEGGARGTAAQLVAELVRLKVDVLVVTNRPSIEAARQATKTIPVVMVLPDNPVELGLVGSLARPGSNITGITSLGRELSGKRLEILKDTVPALSRVGIIWSMANNRVSYRDYEPAARTLKLTVRSLAVPVQNPNWTTFSQDITDAHVGALITVSTSPLLTHRGRILELIIKNRLPGMCEGSDWVEVGGLMSYASNPADEYKRAALYVDRILKGAKPADLPIEQPTKFELVINLKTAKQIGLTIPPNVLARADRVIK